GFMVLYGKVSEIRRRYADHAVMVRTDAVLANVPGVHAVEVSNGSRKLTLEADATSQSVLRALVERGVEIESFEIASLPLEDIFVKVVKEGLGLDQGKSGPPVAEALAGVGGAR